MCDLINLQPELRDFIAYLMPFVDVRGDILQEVNMLVWEKRSQFSSGTNFKAWVFMFARNVTMKYQKRARRDKALMFAPETMEMLAEEFMEDTQVLDERLPLLRRCLAKLGIEDRQLLFRCNRKHGAIEECAKELGCTAASLRGTLFRLRAALRQCVEREEKLMGENL